MKLFVVKKVRRWSLSKQLMVLLRSAVLLRRLVSPRTTQFGLGNWLLPDQA